MTLNCPLNGIFALFIFLSFIAMPQAPEFEVQFRWIDRVHKMIICCSFWGLRLGDNQMDPPAELRSGVAETSRKPRNQIHMVIYNAKKREISRAGCGAPLSNSASANRRPIRPTSLVFARDSVCIRPPSRLRQVVQLSHSESSTRFR